ncbi:MAG: hypothetical protein AAF682_12540 [Planctomycetota bacterium]
MTDEAPALVDKWVEQKKPTYPIVSLKDPAFEDFLEVGFFPTAAVIRPDGTLAYSGSAGMTAGPLGDAMKKAKKGSMWPKSLSKVAKLMQDGKYDKSYAELLKLVEGEKVPEEDQPTAELFQGYLEGLSTTALEDGKSFQEAGNVYLAVRSIEYYAESKVAFPATEDCVKLLEELEAIPEFKKEMKGGEIFADAKLLEDDNDFVEAIKGYKSILKKCKETKIAGLAREAAEKLISDGMVGYKAACPTCRKLRKACKKHHEEVKL